MGFQKLVADTDMVLSQGLSHPKFTKLLEIVSEHFGSMNGASTRIMVFSKFRYVCCKGCLATECDMLLLWWW